MPKLATLVLELESLDKEQFDDHAASSEGLDKLTRVCKELVRDHDVDEWAEPLFRVMEKLDDHVDLGSPGIIVHSLEKFVPHYEPFLMESLKRKPTELAIWMVDRMLRSPGSSDREKWLSVLKSIDKSPLASDDTREGASETLFDIQSKSIPN